MSRLIATRGEMYAHVHENASTGLARNLFWNVRVDLEPIALGGEEWEASFSCEWMVWPARKMKDLDRMGLDTVLRPDVVEASIYAVGAHHWIELEALSISRSADATYRMDAVMSIDVEIDGESLCERASLSCDLLCDGIIVVPENLSPKPSTPEAASKVVAQFFSLEDLDAPEFDRFRYILRETGS